MTVEAADGRADGPGTRPPRSRLRTVVQGAFGLGLAAFLLAWGVPHFAKTSWSKIWDVLTQVPTGTALVLLSGVVVGLYCYTFTLTGSMRGLRHWQALDLLEERPDLAW